MGALERVKRLRYIQIMQIYCNFFNIKYRVECDHITDYDYNHYIFYLEKNREIKGKDDDIDKAFTKFIQCLMENKLEDIK